MTPKDFWIKAAQWGSYMTSSDPGACMYGFDERGSVQSEEHRKACIEWLHVTCRGSVLATETGETPDTAKERRERGRKLFEIQALIDYLRTAPCLNPEPPTWKPVLSGDTSDYFRDNPVRTERYRK